MPVIDFIRWPDGNRLHLPELSPRIEKPLRLPLAAETGIVSPGLKLSERDLDV
jgi:hypothetical protein